MRKGFGIILLTLLIATACSHRNITRSNSSSNSVDTTYTVYKIDSIGNFYLIYAKRTDTLYKIVSEKKYDLRCKKIKTGKSYSFNLVSIGKNPIIIDGARMYAFLVNCLTFDEETVICLERENGITDLFYTKDIKGLCFIK